MFDDKPDPIEENWPYDGPHTPDSVESATRALSDLVRYLNNATQPANASESLPSAPVVRRITGDLVTSTARLDQFVEQLDTALRRQGGDPSLFDERGPGYSASDTVAETSSHLDEVRSRLTSAHAHLGKAHSAVWRLGHDRDPVGHGDPLAEHADTWICPNCGDVRYLDMDGDASDQLCPCSA